MRFLVAGGAGFIGSHFVEAIAHNPHHSITVVDSLVSGSRDNYIDSEHKNIKYIVEDIQDFHICGKFDTIVNFACPASPVAYQSAPIHTLMTNVRGTYNLAKMAFDTRARFFQASTSEVYGNPLVHPQTEEYWGNVNSYGPRACYDEGKRAAETLIFDLQKMGLDARIVRIFNTYGPRMAENDGRVVSNFIVQTLKGNPLTVYGQGLQTRSFCYVSDTVEAILEVIRGYYDKPLNVGNPQERTVIELAYKVMGLIPENKAKIEHKSMPVDDPVQRCPDISKMKSLYKWEPKITIDQGLKLTIDYFRSRGVR